MPMVPRQMHHPSNSGDHSRPIHHRDIRKKLALPTVSEGNLTPIYQNQDPGLHDLKLN